MPFHHSGRKRKALSLPSRLAAELVALGHPVGPSTHQHSAHHSRTSKPVKFDQEFPKHQPHSTDRPRPKSTTNSKTIHPSSRPSPEGKRKKLKLDDSTPDTREPSSSRSKPKTALEKLLSKQQVPNSVNQKNDRKSKLKNGEEELEDQQIAWLEAQLGLKADQESKSKLRKEFEEDGLEDLFDGLDELDQLVENLATKHNPNQSSRVVDLSGSDCSDEDSDLHSDCSLESESTWHGCGHDMEVLDTHTSYAETSNLHTSMNSKPIPPQDESASQKASMAGNRKCYIPPHLRSKQVESPPSLEVHAEKPDQQVIEPRLRRQLMGILNRVSPTSVPVCLESLRELYITHPRAVITQGLAELILTLISSNEPLSNALLVTYAAFVSAIVRGGVQVSGVEIGWAATFIADLASRICQTYQREDSNLADTHENGKKGTNLLGCLSHLYFFQDVSCMLVYDVVRLLVERGLNEESVEGLIVLLKASGTQLRHDDPAALKDIIILVQTHRKNLVNPSPRIKFMLDTLSDLKNNKTRKELQSISGTTEELQQNLKKYLGGLSKRSGLDPEPIQFNLKDLQEGHKKGKWWLIGAPWKGDPLVDANIQLQAQNSDGAENDCQNKVIMSLARRQGMNTDVRRSIFNAIMTGEDYVDACEKINQLGLNSIQQREIIRVLLHCLAKEKIYNPYYTMIGQKLASESRSIQITMQFLLWDFFRELGERDVGGHEMLKSLELESLHDCDAKTRDAVDGKKLNHFAWAYAWWIAQGSLSITILKPLPFGFLKQRTEEFLTKLISLIFLSIQSTSPVLAISTRAKSIMYTSSAQKRLDTAPIAEVFKRTLANSALSHSVLNFLQDDDGIGKGFNFHLKNLIDHSNLLSSSSLGNTALVDFLGCLVSKNQVVLFLNTINQSKSFLVEFLNNQL